MTCTSLQLLGLPETPYINVFKLILLIIIIVILLLHLVIVLSSPAQENLHFGAGDNGNCWK